MSSTATSDFRRRRKVNLIKVCGEQCNLCGYHTTISALEFHHIDETQKEYGIGSNGTCRDLEKDLAEIKKCILICANCHREVHDGLYSKEELYEKKIYNEDIANELRQEKIALFTKTDYFCLECGKKISKGTKTNLCEECYRKTTRVQERPSREILKDLIRNKPFTHIGKMYGVSDNSIKKWCVSYNLPSLKKEIIKYTDVQWQQV